MGFGTDPLGEFLLGVDFGVTTERRDVTPPVALKFDGVIKNFLIDDEGRYVEAHPIDTKVFHRLRIRSFSIRSAPGTGNNVGSPQWIDKMTIGAHVRDQVRLTVQDMIDANEILDRGVELDTKVPGRVQYIFNYVNLKTGRTGQVPLR